MAHIKKIKTWYGLRYAVVEPFVANTYVEDGSNKKALRTTTRDCVVEYKVGERSAPAIFPVNKEGLREAKKVQHMFNNVVFLSKLEKLIKLQETEKVQYMFNN